MTDGEILLNWLWSERHGNLSLLRDRLAWYASGISAVSWKKNTDLRWISDMSALGHIETSFAHNRWMCSPPVLTRLPAMDGLAILVGGRTAALREAVEAVAVDESVTDSYDYLLEDVDGSSDMPLPPTLYLEPASEKDFRAMVGRLKRQEPRLSYQACASSALAAILRPGRPVLRRVPGPIDSDTAELAKLNTAAIELPVNTAPRLWEQANRFALTESAYRWRTRFGYQFGICTSDHWLGGPRSEVLYHYLSRIGKNVFQWSPYPSDSSAGVLKVPLRVDLPPLQRRSAALASGQLGQYGQISIAYKGLTEEIARKIVGSLGQALPVNN